MSREIFRSSRETERGGESCVTNRMLETCLSPCPRGGPEPRVADTRRCSPSIIYEPPRASPPTRGSSSRFAGQFSAVFSCGTPISSPARFLFPSRSVSVRMTASSRDVDCALCPTVHVQIIAEETRPVYNFPSFPVLCVHLVRLSMRIAVWETA